MEFFSDDIFFWYNYIYPLFICGGILAVVQCRFLLNFTKTRAKNWCYIFYILLFFALHSIAIQLLLPALTLKFLEFVCVFTFVYFVLRCPVALAAIAAGIVVVVDQLSAGILVPLSKIWIDWFVTSPASLTFVLSMIFLPLFNLTITHYSYQYILTKCQIGTVRLKPYLAIIFAPLLLIILSLGLIIEMGYSTTAIDKNTGKIIAFFNDYQVLCISGAAIICMGAVLFAFKKFMDHLAAEQQQVLLKQQLAMQKEYLGEAQSRYALTRSFRHDIKNHLLVVNDLLEEGETRKAQEYLKKLEEVAGTLSFIAHTGNAAVDALLSNKLGPAKQSGIFIEVE